MGKQVSDKHENYEGNPFTMTVVGYNTEYSVPEEEWRMQAEQDHDRVREFLYEVGLLDEEEDEADIAADEAAIKAGATPFLQKRAATGGSLAEMRARLRREKKEGDIKDPPKTRSLFPDKPEDRKWFD